MFLLRIFIPFLILSIFAAAVNGAEPSGEREIKIIYPDGEVKQDPLWKILWDQARHLNRQKKYEEAIESYRQLLQAKPNIELAQFEYGKVLETAGQYQEAIKNLESLVYNYPDKLEYYPPLARCFDQLEQYQKAAKYYGILFNKDPYGPYSIPSLEGLIRNLQQENNDQSLEPLLRQLVLRKPEDPAPLYTLANLLFRSGKKEDAIGFYITLINKFRVEDPVLFEVELVLNEDEHSHDLMGVRLEYLKRNPQYTPFRKKVIHEYLKNGQGKEALEHLIALETQQGYMVPDLILTMADIYLNQMRRPDKALQYYERYQVFHPEVERVGTLIESIQKVLAEDFVVIVQNDGAKLLWEDLRNLTRDRKAIFLIMAAMLKKQKDQENYLKILHILQSSYPQDQEINLLLVKAMQERGEHRQSLEQLVRIAPTDRAKEHYTALMASGLTGIDDSRLAVKIGRKYLQDNPGALSVRRIVYEKAVDRLMYDTGIEQFKALEKRKQLSQIDLTSHIKFLTLLRKSGAYGLVQQCCNQLMSQTEQDNDIVILKSFLANMYVFEGQLYSAEQEYRRLILEYPENIIPYLSLIEVLIEGREYSQAEAWLNNLQNFTRDLKLSSNSAQRLKLLQVVRNLETGSYAKGSSELKKILEQNSHGKGTDFLKMQELLVQLLFLQGELEQCHNAAALIIKTHPSNKFAGFILQYLPEKKSIKASSNKSTGNKPSFEEKIDIYKRLGLDAELLSLYEKAIHNAEQSAYVKVQIAEVYEDGYHYDKAIALFEDLAAMFPRNRYFKTKSIELEYKRGNFKDVLSQIQNLEAVTAIEKGEERYQLALLKARSLWALGLQEQAVTEYERLLQPSVYDQFDRKLAEKNIEPSAVSIDKSFWDVLTFSDADSFKKLDVFLTPAFLVNNLTAQVVAVANPFYADYRWEQIIKSEYGARRALRNRDYFYAEIQYEKLVKEEQQNFGDEKLLDLAQIYNRLGKYGQEAELYEDITATRTPGVDLSKRIEKTKSVLKPNTDLNYTYIAEEGRDGYKDIKLHKVGASGWLVLENQHKLDMQYDYNFFSDHLTDRTLHGSQIFGKYTVGFSDDFSITAGLGGFQRESYDNTVLYEVILDGQIDQYLRSYFKLKQDVVSDTIESLAEGILQRDYELGFVIDSIPRVVLGGDGKYRQFSEDNDQRIIHLFSSYNLFKEKYLFKIQYDFNFINSQNENDDQNDDLNIPYWSPGSYNHHGISLYLDLLLSDNVSFGGAPGHISFEYGLGYENNENVTHRGEVNIFLEMNDSFLLKGSLSFFDTENYESRDGIISLVYRW